MANKTTPAYTVAQIQRAVELATTQGMGYAARVTGIGQRSIYRYVRRARTNAPIRGLGERKGTNLYLTIDENKKVHTRLESRDPEYAPKTPKMDTPKATVRAKAKP